jgi:hypothetical protein
MKRAFSAFTIFALLFSQLFLIGNSATADQVGQLNRQLLFFDSTAFDGGLIQVNTGSSSEPCDGAFTNPKCAVATSNLTTTNTLTLCDSNISIPCIENVFAKNEKTDWVKGESAGSRTPPWDFYAFPAKPEFQLGAANRNNLFTFAGIGDPANNLFEINPTLLRGITKGVLKDPAQLSISIHAVYEAKDQPEPGKFRGDVKTGADVVKEDERCIDGINITTKCWKYGSNPLTNEFKLVLRLPSAPSGWLSGRLFNPNVIFEKVSGTTPQPFRLTISGSPVTTPAFNKQYFYDVPAEKAAWDKVNKVFDLPWSNKISMGPGLTPTSIDDFVAMVKADPALDTATSVVDKWLVNVSWGKRYDGQLGKCPNTGFLGYVGSNSLTYASELPTYDPATGSLIYRVASPHFMPAGKEFSGVYSMVLNRDYANCIWKLSGAAISASVEVLNDNGKPKIATVSAKFNKKTINFLASGFTFSSPTLRVKLVQSKPIVAKKNTSTKRVVITCKKGTTTKQISGVNPKCPAGFAKK